MIRNGSPHHHHQHPTARGRRRRRPLDVAIVGMACRYPGAPDLETFWRNVVEGRDSTGDVPPDRWDPDVFFDPDASATANDRVYCRRGGFLEAPVSFDPARHGVMPLAVEGGEPEQFLVLDAARAALEDAGMPDGVPRGRRVEVVVGRGNYFNRGNLTRLQHGPIVAQTLGVLRALHPDWSDADLAAVAADLKSGLPPLEAGTVAGQLTNATAGRVADRLDLTGTSYVVDAASASALVALDQGARALAEGRADLAIVGAVYVAADVDFYQVFSLLGALSRGGTGRPFGAEADGMVPGEGVGVVVLRRLHDAERDGDRVYAVLRGVGVSSDGRGAGLAAPSARGHVRAMRRAYRQAVVEPDTVGLVEGHGLGVPAADRAELRALRAVFPKPETGHRVLGAVSSNIGHAMPAAGMAGLIKASLALYHRLLPPTLHAERPHPLLADDDSPFALGRAPRPWIHGDPTHPRRAGVNAFGFAGVNAHAVLEEHTESADGPTPGVLTRWETEAVLLGAADRAGLIEVAQALLDWLDSGANARVDLKDLAATLNTGLADFPVRAGLVVSTVDDLRARLRWLASKLADPSCQSVRDARGTYFWERPLGGPRRLAFLYAGEGSQYPGMLADLCPFFPEARRVLDTSDAIALARRHARVPSEELYGEVTSGGQGLWGIGTAVNVVLSTQWAIHQVLGSIGLVPDAVVGHSSGELLALTAAGALGKADELGRRLGALGSIFEGLERDGRVPAAQLVAVAKDRTSVEDACQAAGFGPEAIVAIDNCPHQVVIAVAPAKVERVLRALRERGLLCEPLPFQRAYHTPAFAEAIGPVQAFFEALPMRAPTVKVYSCSTACPMPNGPDALRELAVAQWTRPVEFRSTVRAMHDDGIRLFVEVGARGSLTGYVEDSLRDLPHFAVAANLPRRSGPTQLNHLVASLYAQGVGLQPEALYARRRPRPIALDRDLPAPRPTVALALGSPKMRISPELASRLASRTATHGRDINCTSKAEPNGRPHANGKPAVNGHRNGHAPASVPPPAVETLTAPVAIADSTWLDYFETMDLFLETQREVMEAYLARPADPGRSNVSAAVVAAPEPPIPVVPPVDPLAPATDRPVDVVEVLLEQVGRRTGYPPEMLDLEHDMEADLGIDSIKRVEVLGELQALGLVPAGVDMDRLGRCRTLGEVAGQLQSPERPKGARPSSGAGPTGWPGVVESFVEGREFVGTWPLDAETDPVAWHHTLGGRRLSAIEPDRLGLPVLPFTVMAEMLAQAAVVLAPGRRVAALREVQATRWVPYVPGPLDVELRATRDPARPEEVRVTLRPRFGRGEVAFEGVVAFADADIAAPAPVARPFDLGSDRQCDFTADELYADQWLFHGPPLQALTHVGRSCPAGIEGTLTVLPPRDLLPERLWPALHTDPIVLDAFTHLLGCWGIDRQAGAEGSVMFPFRVSEIVPFGPAPAVGTDVSCRILVREVSRHKVCIDAELVRPDGTVWMRIDGWEDWRFYWPDRYRDVFRAPDRLHVGELLEIDGLGPGALAVWLAPPADMGRPVWRDVLEWVQLGPAERAANRARGENEPALSLRIWGRTAAKEAARRLLDAADRPPIYPADLVVENDPHGRPSLRSLDGRLGSLPAVSIAHTEGVAVALAAIDSEACVGIDVELVRPLGAEFEEAALLEPERRWLDERTGPTDRDEWVARLWCCKEAAAKATGLGMIAGPASVEVVRVDRESGRAEVRLGPDLAARRPDLGAGPFVGRTGRRGDHAWALTLCERSAP